MLTVTSISLLGGVPGDGCTRDEPWGEDAEGTKGSPTTHHRLAPQSPASRVRLNKFQEQPVCCQS